MEGIEEVGLPNIKRTVTEITLTFGRPSSRTPYKPNHCCCLNNAKQFYAKENLFQFPPSTLQQEYAKLIIQYDIGNLQVSHPETRLAT